MSQDPAPYRETDIVVKDCPECHQNARLTQIQEFGVNAPRILIYQCNSCNYLWAACYKCDAIALPKERIVMRSTDPLGVTAFTLWQCTARPGHRWHYIDEALTPEDLFNTPPSDE